MIWLGRREVTIRKPLKGRIIVKKFNQNRLSMFVHEKWTALRSTVEQQQKLWHDNVYDALRTAIQWLGGFKAVGAEIWPEKAPDKAGEHLAACCNPERREVLNPEQLILIMRKARQSGCHAVAAFIAEEAGYGPPQPVEPQDEVLEVQRAFTRGVDELKHLIERAERAQLRLGRDFGLK